MKGPRGRSCHPNSNPTAAEVKNQPQWKGWSRLDQGNFLQDIFRLSLLGSAEHAMARALRDTFETPVMTQGGGDATAQPQDTSTYAATYASGLATWPNNYDLESLTVPLASALYEACKVRACPAAVTNAAVKALAEHNVDTVTGKKGRFGLGSTSASLPSASNMVQVMYDELQHKELKAILPNLSASQVRVCLVTYSFALASPRLNSPSFYPDWRPMAVLKQPPDGL
jgi:hypothetical protein